MKMKTNRIFKGKVLFIILGIVSTIWFLVRVLPKPSRAAYPCIRATAPFMSSFILYLLSITGSALLFKRGWRLFSRSRYMAASLILTFGLLVSLLISNLMTGESYAGVKVSVPEDFPANEPYGVGLGNHPGRVVWSWDPDATDENCTNSKSDPVRGEDGYFMESNNNRQVISRMVDDMVTKLTGAALISSAWDSLFIDLNRRKGLGAISYQAGQTIFIKINQGQAGWLSNAGPDGDLSFIDASWAAKYYGEVETSPMVVIEILDQLVNGYGVPEENIYVGDPITHIYKHTYDQMFSAFPAVRYVDKDANHADIGRTILTPSSQPSMFYSDKGAQMKSAISDSYYSEMENADYMINIAALKAHALAGITLTTKNHFGSITRDGASHLHPGLICEVDDMPVRTDYGLYRVHTDIMGHEKLGGNTVLFVVDGLWGGTEAKDPPVKWNMPPFNGDWSNSIFAAQDQVALESVCFDFLRSEFDDPEGPAKARPWMGGVDDYLHQAADKQFWPVGITYDPENDGIPIGSLGAHEHWNNQIEKEYSRNQGFDYGIELLKIDKTYTRETIIAREASILPKIDGEHGDRCWLEADWHQLDQVWVPWGTQTDDADFSGRFKLSWSESENLLYYYVEIKDDHFIDGYEFPGDSYLDFDLLEVYLDEDLSGGFHAFDKQEQSDRNAENAFGYHLLVNVPPTGTTTSQFHACDLNNVPEEDHLVDYANHFQEFVMKRENDLIIYEFSLKVYDDSYQHTTPEGSRVSLEMNKEMGLSLAYSDNDSPGSGRDSYHGSVWVPSSANNDHWFDADYFGIAKLVESADTQNYPVEVIGSIPDFQITHLEEDLIITDNISALFNDPDGDPLEFSVNHKEELLKFKIQDNQLKVWAGLGYEGETTYELIATDGEFNAVISCTVFIEGTSIIEDFELGPGIRCYPNPFEENLYLEFNTGNEFIQNASLRVCNLRGQMIYTETFEVELGSKTLKIVSLPEAYAGLYVVEVRIEEKIFSRIMRKH